MDLFSGLKTVWEGLGRLSRRQKLVAGILALVVLATWLAVCIVVVSILA